MPQGKRSIVEGPINWELIDKLLETTELPAGIIAQRAGVSKTTVSNRQKKIGLEIVDNDLWTGITVRRKTTTSA